MEVYSDFPVRSASEGKSLCCPLHVCGKLKAYGLIPGVVEGRHVERGDRRLEEVAVAVDLVVKLENTWKIPVSLWNPGTS